MIKNRKVQRMLAENGLEQGNYSLVVRLKRKIEDLEKMVEEQQGVIEGLKRDQRITKMGEMEVQIVHLRDENKRLVLFIEQLKSGSKNKDFNASKKNLVSSQKYESRRPIVTEFKCEGKMSELLKENEHLRRELTTIKVNESFHQKRKTTQIDRSSIFHQRNAVELEQLQQKKMDLEQESLRVGAKVKYLEAQVAQLVERNEELERIHYRHLRLNRDSPPAGRGL